MKVILYQLHDYDNHTNYISIEQVKAAFKTPPSYLDAIMEDGSEVRALDLFLKAGIAKETEFDEKELAEYARLQIEEAMRTNEAFQARLKPGQTVTGWFGSFSTDPEQIIKEYKRLNQYSWA